MNEKLPKITRLEPIVLPDNRRVTMEMVVENLPTVFSNVAFNFPGSSEPAAAGPANPDKDAPSPYPDIELAILDNKGQEVTSLLIVEHKEPYTSLTLHLRQPKLDEQYTARAEMTYQGEVLDVVESPFTLKQTGDE